MKRPHSMRLLHGVREHDTKIFFFFFKLRYGPLRFNARKFHQHLTQNEIE